MADARAVIFDLDDTLYPERAYVFSGFAAVAEAFKEILGDPTEAAGQMRRLFDTEHRRRVFNRLLIDRSLTEDPDLVSRMITTYRTHRPAIELYRDADAALTRFRKTHKLGLLTDGPTVMQRAKINALKLGPRVEAIILTDELGPEFSKPHPRSFEQITEQLDVEPGRCTYVADNPAKDFIGPNALGWGTVRVIRPAGVYHDAAPAEGGAAQHRIDALDQLDAVLGPGPTDLYRHR